jgi:hypothetical protein
MMNDSGLKGTFPHSIIMMKYDKVVLTMGIETTRNER